MKAYIKRKTRFNEQKVIACIWVAFISAIAFFWASPVSSQDVQIKGEAYIVGHDDKNREILLEAESGVAPGQLLEYRFYYQNNTSEPLPGVVFSAPIPKDTSYVDGTAHAESNAEVQVRLQGEEQWQKPPVLRERLQEDGTRKKVFVSPSEYGELRWLFAEDLPGNSISKISYRVKVESN